jgi:hypothetical protein
MELDPADAITIAGYQAWDNDVDELWSPDGSRADRIIDCAWDDRVGLILAMMGGATQDGEVADYIAAVTYPDAPTLMRLRAVKPEGLGVRKVGVNGMIGYEYARLRLTYETPPRGTAEEQEIGSVSLDIGSEILAVPQDVPTFKWGSDDEDVAPEASPAVQITTITMVKESLNQPKIPLAVIVSLLDHVHDGDFKLDVDGETVAGAKVLYRGARTRRRFTTGGAKNYDIEHLLQVRSQDWNKFLRPTAGGFSWDTVKYKDGSELFPTGDLNKLFPRNPHLGINP